MNDKKTWLITGCSTGFGRELALYVARQGEQVVATVRKEEQRQALEQEVPGLIDAILMDVQHPEQVTAGVKHIADKYGRLDVLVNNAGYGDIGPMEDIDEDRMIRQIDVNVYGPVRLIRAVMPMMRAQRSGYVMNVTSIAGLRGGAGLGIYNASKFALEGIGEALAAETKHLGIHVTNVEPGPFKTEWAGASATYSENIHEDYTESAGALAELLKGKNGNQPGDPAKGAAAMYALTKLDNPPVHLPLGNMAFEAAIDKAESLKKEILAFEHVGRRTDFSD